MLHETGRRTVWLIAIFVVIFSSSCWRRSFSPPPVAGRSTLEGVVLRDSDGSALEGAVVLLCQDISLGVGCFPKLGETRTDADGRYSFRDIPPGEYVPAVQLSKQAVFAMQRQTLGKVIPETVKYTVAAGQVMIATDLRLSREPEKLDDPPVKLVYPVSSASISETRPTLKWEAVPGAQYGIALSRVDGDHAVDVQLTDHPFELIDTNRISVRKDLDDGLYQWVVHAFRPNDNHSSVGDREATAYFTVAKGQVSDH